MVNKAPERGDCSYDSFVGTQGNSQAEEIQIGIKTGIRSQPSQDLNPAQRSPPIHLSPHPTYSPQKP